MVKKINWATLSKLIPIIGLALFAYIIYDIGLKNILKSFTLIPINYFLAALLLFIPATFLVVYKWQYICKKQKMNLDFFYLFKIYLIGIFYGTITPAGLGWHIRAFYIKKKLNISFEKSFANSLIETTSSYIVGVFLSVIGAVIIFDKFPGLFPVLFGFFVFYLVSFVVLIKKNRGSKLFKIFVKPLIPSKYKKQIEGSVGGLYEDIPSLKNMLFPFFIDFIVWFLRGTQVFIIALAFGINISYVTFILLTVISVAVTSILPISVGGIGVREGAFVILAVSFGVASDVAFVISLSGFVVKMFIPSLFGLVFAFKKKI